MQSLGLDCFDEVWFEEAGNTLLRMKVIALSLAAVFAIVVVFIAVNHSTFTKVYTCEGYKSVNGASTEQDLGRLQIDHLAFWIRLWNSESDGSAIFRSTKFSFFESSFRESGDGNLTVYTGISPDKTFSFRRATDELHIQDGQTTFIGNCIAAI